MYDYIKGYTRCGFCDEVKHIEEQIKFPMDRLLKLYIIGDNIDTQDGEYDYLSGCRSPVYTCENCGNENKYTIIVQNGILTSLKTESQPVEIRTETINLIRIKRRKEQQEWFNSVFSEEERSKMDCVIE